MLSTFSNHPTSAPSVPSPSTEPHTSEMRSDTSHDGQTVVYITKSQFPSARGHCTPHTRPFAPPPFILYAPRACLTHHQFANHTSPQTQRTECGGLGTVHFSVERRTRPLPPFVVFACTLDGSYFDLVYTSATLTFISTSLVHTFSDFLHY